jgi:predicted RNase H-like HicB family nuclease
MRRRFTLEYWMDDGWYVGRLKEVPGVFSQGETLAELEENIQDAYETVLADDQPVELGATQSKEVELEV